MTAYEKRVLERALEDLDYIKTFLFEEHSKSVASIEKARDVIANALEFGPEKA